MGHITWSVTFVYVPGPKTLWASTSSWAWQSQKKKLLWSQVMWQWSLYITHCVRMYGTAVWHRFDVATYAAAP